MAVTALASKAVKPLHRVGRIPSLDGLRAIAIACVMASHHMQMRLGDALGASPLLPFLQVGADFGVRVFFVLSGFLITSQLVSEQERSGSISLGRFYLRRSLRIFPAFYTYLIVIALLYALGVFTASPPSGKAFAIAASYATDYNIPIARWTLGHSWTLSIEEQFYLLWPLLLLLLRPRYASRVLVAAILLAPFIRCAWFIHDQNELTSGYKYHFEASMDSLAVGCLVAIYWSRVGDFLRRIQVPKLVAYVTLAGGFGYLFLFNVRQPFLRLLIGLSLTNTLIGLAIAVVVVHPPAWLNAFPLRFVGKLSYSLYLWQQVFVEHVRLGAWWIVFAFGAAIMSYYLVEKPIMQWRDRLSWLRDTPALG